MKRNAKGQVVSTIEGSAPKVRAKTQRWSRPASSVRVRGGFGGEGFAAAAALGGVGIGNFETAARQGVGKIHHHAADIIRTERVNEHGDTKEAGGRVVGARLVENHAVLQAGATAFFHVDAQALGGALGIGGELGFDFVGGVFRQFHHGCNAALVHGNSMPEIAARRKSRLSRAEAQRPQRKAAINLRDNSMGFSK